MDSDDFLSEVSRHFEDAEVKAVHPSYRQWFSEPGVHGQEVESLLAELTLNTKDANQVVMIGFSVGAYLATLLGNLLPATHVLAYVGPTNLRTVNLGNTGKPENIDERYFDLLPHCNGVPKMMLVVDDSQQGLRNAHNAIQAERLAAVPNVTIEHREKFRFRGEYFPNGHFARDLQSLLA